MIETEIKILNINEEKIRKRLKRIGAKHTFDEYQINRIYDVNCNNVLARIREIGKRSIFTTKKRINSDVYKKNEELECSISDPEIFEKQLFTLGFKRLWYLEKKRSIYQYKNAKICVDKYPGIPLFIEIEGDPLIINEVVSLLGYTMRDTCSMNYREVVDKYFPGLRELRFCEVID